jgi:YtkA-like
MFGTTGADDECKYDVSWSSTPIRLAEDFVVTTVVKSRVDGKPVTGADVRIQAFLSDVHPAPATLPTVTETAPGVYRVDPIRFDRSGRWTMRFHFFDTCSEIQPDSPHAHAAFFVDVP